MDKPKIDAKRYDNPFGDYPSVEESTPRKIDLSGFYRFNAAMLRCYAYTVIPLFGTRLSSRNPDPLEEFDRDVLLGAFNGELFPATLINGGSREDMPEKNIEIFPSDNQKEWYDGAYRNLATTLATDKRTVGDWTVFSPLSSQGGNPPYDVLTSWGTSDGTAEWRLSTTAADFAAEHDRGPVYSQSGLDFDGTFCSLSADRYKTRSDYYNAPLEETLNDISRFFYGSSDLKQPAVSAIAKVVDEFEGENDVLYAENGSKWSFFRKLKRNSTGKLSGDIVTNRNLVFEQYANLLNLYSRYLDYSGGDVSEQIFAQTDFSADFRHEEIKTETRLNCEQFCRFDPFRLSGEMTLSTVQLTTDSGWLDVSCVNRMTTGRKQSAEYAIPSGTIHTYFTYRLEDVPGIFDYDGISSVAILSADRDGNEFPAETVAAARALFPENAESKKQKDLQAEQAELCAVEAYYQEQYAQLQSQVSGYSAQYQAANEKYQVDDNNIWISATNVTLDKYGLGGDIPYNTYEEGWEGYDWTYFNEKYELIEQGGYDEEVNQLGLQWESESEASGLLKESLDEMDRLAALIQPYSDKMNELYAWRAQQIKDIEAKYAAIVYDLVLPDEDLVKQYFLSAELDGISALGNFDIVKNAREAVVYSGDYAVEPRTLYPSLEFSKFFNGIAGYYPSRDFVVQSNVSYSSGVNPGADEYGDVIQISGVNFDVVDDIGTGLCADVHVARLERRLVSKSKFDQYADKNDYAGSTPDYGEFELSANLELTGAGEPIELSVLSVDQTVRVVDTDGSEYTAQVVQFSLSGRDQTNVGIASGGSADVTKEIIFTVDSGSGDLDKFEKLQSLADAENKKVFYRGGTDSEDIRLYGKLLKLCARLY